MRTYHRLSSLISSTLSSNSDCDGPSYTQCLFTHPSQLVFSITTEFILCTFTDLTSDDSGGAISFHDKSGGSLTVSQCYFDTCITKGVFGGAVYASSVLTIEVELSVFLRCKCVNKTDNVGGGAILLTAIRQRPSVCLCDFIDCYSQEDGGALDIQESFSHQQDAQTIFNCRFISNSVFDGVENVGGGVCNWGNDPDVGVTSCLFAHNSAHGWAGGVYIDFTNQTPHIIRFSVFVDNKCENNIGHDVAFYNSIPDEPLVFCFSTTTITPRAYPFAHQDDWLPQANSNSKLFAAESERGPHLSIIR